MRRPERLAESLKEEISEVVGYELDDPELQNATVTDVEVSPDMRQARVHVSVMGSDIQQNLSLRGLRSAAGFLQAKVAQRIETRYTPRLTFELDQGVKRSIEIARRLREVLPPAEGTDADQTESDDATANAADPNAACEK